MFFGLQASGLGGVYRLTGGICVALLMGCGGGAGGADSTLGTVTLELSMVQLPAAVATQALQPMVLDGGVVAAPEAATDTAAVAQRMGTALTADGEPTLQPMASGGSYTIYTPAQIRAAYGMPTLPAVGTVLTQAQAAALGAGQTIYLIDAYHDPYIAKELAAFNARFGLPECTVTRLAPSQTLPLASASTTGCELLLASSTPGGSISATEPNYDYTWATEIALDVQWAHATAPLARLVLVEAASGALSNMLGAIKLANNMGAGVVSMSFGGKEGTWTSLVDSVFASNRMSYVAATGDAGPAVDWPAVATRVVAVGGTTLRLSATGERSETSWSSTAGGFSAYTPTPDYQGVAVPGFGSSAFRGVADVAMNADPTTGQYVARFEPGATAPVWISVAGTSLATAQWSGVMAVANAQRAAAGLAPLGAPHALLYGPIATTPGYYDSAFNDVVSGTNGSCISCSSALGYDTLTGLGTPKVAGLLALMSQPAALLNTQTTTTNPSSTTSTSTTGSTTIGTAAISGAAGGSLSGRIEFSDPAATRLKITITGVPKGLELSANGTAVVVKWTSARLGSYNLRVQSTNDLGQTAQATVRLAVL